MPNSQAKQVADNVMAKDAASKNHYMADYNSKGKKPGSYQPRIESEHQPPRADRNALSKEKSNRPAMKGLKLYDEVMNSNPDVLAKELALAR